LYDLNNIFFDFVEYVYYVKPVFMMLRYLNKFELGRYNYLLLVCCKTYPPYKIRTEFYNKFYNEILKIFEAKIHLMDPTVIIY